MTALNFTIYINKFLGKFMHGKRFSLLALCPLASLVLRWRPGLSHFIPRFPRSRAIR